MSENGSKDIIDGGEWDFSRERRISPRAQIEREIVVVMG